MKRLSISVTSPHGIEALCPNKLATLNANVTRLAVHVGKEVKFDDGRYLHWIMDIDSKTTIGKVVIRIRQKGNRKVLKTLTGILVTSFGCRRSNPVMGLTTVAIFAKILAKELCV